MAGYSSSNQKKGDYYRAIHDGSIGSVNEKPQKIATDKTSNPPNLHGCHPYYRTGTAESGEEGRTGRPTAAASEQVPSPSGYLAEALDLTSARRERASKEVGDAPTMVSCPPESRVRLPECRIVPWITTNNWGDCRSFNVYM